MDFDLRNVVTSHDKRESIDLIRNRFRNTKRNNYAYPFVKQFTVANQFILRYQFVYPPQNILSDTSFLIYYRYINYPFVFSFKKKACKYTKSRKQAIATSSPQIPIERCGDWRERVPKLPGTSGKVSLVSTTKRGRWIIVHLYNVLAFQPRFPASTAPPSGAQEEGGGGGGAQLAPEKAYS